jgi:flagellar hook-basal body complex protein FliE
MKITPHSLQPAFTPRVTEGGGAGAKEGVTGFAKSLGRALDQLSKVQNEADEMVTRMVTGEVDDIHQVVLAVEKANLSLQLAVEVRNKVVEAYQEIMHMQV